VADGALAGAKKGALREGRWIVWVDESGFSLLPAVVRSLAPRGHPPTLRFPVTREHLSVISGITPSGRLLLQIQDHAFRTPDVVQFLRHLLRHLPGKVLVIWDGAPIHRARPIKEFLSQGAAKRLRLEQLPGYAPDLNPDEGIWGYLKHVELRNVCCTDLDELHHHLRLATARLRHKRAVIRGCVTHCGYAL
jgi:transposase